MREKLRWALVVVVSMALGATVVVGIDSLRTDASGPAAVIESVSSPSDSNVAQTIPEDVADLYDKVRPSVVKITTGNEGSFGGGVGSGVVIDKEGRILTNYHVVQGAGSIDVIFADGTSVEAKVLGTDPGNDLAVLDVDVAADKLTPATLGDSAAVRVGEFVIAVGNPFDIDGTLTTGVVSGVGRTLGGSGRPLRQLIQSDAAINPGNSGGGLFNRRGELIGITTAIENPSGDRVFVGVGYAVPVGTAKRFLPQMISGQAVEHPRLGIRMENVTPTLAESRGIDAAKGVVIVQVESGSAAARAGLRGGRTSGDIIVAIDGVEIAGYDDLGNYIDSRDVGDKVKVTVIRDGGKTTVEVTLEAWRSSAT